MHYFCFTGIKERLEAVEADIFREFEEVSPAWFFSNFIPLLPIFSILL